MKIILVEEDELLADLVSFRLELLGHGVVCCGTAKKMQASLSNESFDLLIIDTHLPDSAGNDVLRKLRLEYSSERLPILVLSLALDLSLVEQAYKAGANDYLITPFNPATLQEKIDRLLLLRQSAA